MTTASCKTKISPPQLAQQWGIDVAKVLKWIKAGKLRAIDASTRRGGRPRYLIDQTDLAAFEASRTVQPPMPKVRRRRADPNVVQFFNGQSLGRATAKTPGRKGDARMDCISKPRRWRASSAVKLSRTTFETSRLLDFQTILPEYLGAWNHPKNSRLGYYL